MSIYHIVGFYILVGNIDVIDCFLAPTRGRARLVELRERNYEIMLIVKIFMLLGVEVIFYKILCPLETIFLSYPRHIRTIC